MAVSKVPILESFSEDDFKSGNIENLEALSRSSNKSVLYCGTRILKCRETSGGTPRMVVRSVGFHTTKGRLVRSILYPPPNTFEFYLDSFKFLGIMGIIAFFGFLFTVTKFALNGATIGNIIVHAFDLITTVVPPALPATLSIGINFALGRLNKKRIFCISPQRINQSGKVDVACFDKTVSWIRVLSLCDSLGYFD